MLRATRPVANSQTQRSYIFEFGAQSLPWQHVKRTNDTVGTQIRSRSISMWQEQVLPGVSPSTQDFCEVRGKADGGGGRWNGIHLLQPYLPLRSAWNVVGFQNQPGRGGRKGEANAYTAVGLSFQTPMTSWWQAALGLGLLQGQSQARPILPRPLESLQSGRALPGKRKGRSRRGLRHRESSSHQTLHLLHLKNYLDNVLPAAPAPRPPPGSRAALSASLNVWKINSGCAAPNDQVYQELIVSKETRAQLVV